MNGFHSSEKKIEVCDLLQNPVLRPDHCCQNPFDRINLFLQNEPRNHGLCSSSTVKKIDGNNIS